MQNLRKTNETGRSMVEMLGVLAIIGVLSVTGVAGYKAAVRKALANKLLNQASMRATDVATQIGSGNLDSLGNDAFDGNLGSGVTMTPGVKGPDGYTDYDESDEQFTLILEGLDEEMCQQMQSMAGGSRSVVRAVLCDGDKAILTFNKDLSANPVASDFEDNEEGCTGSGFNWCSGLTNPTCEKDCCSGITLNDCQESCDSSTGEITPKDDGTECTTSDGKEGTCSDGVCEETPTCLTSGSCMNNEGLCEGYYCNVGGSCDFGIREYTITAGDITALPSTIEKNGKYHIGDCMTWDAAYYYCEALSKIDDSITGMAKKDSFEPVSFDGELGWTNTLDDGSTAPSTNECIAFTVNISSGAVDYYDRSGMGYHLYAVCE